MIDVECTCGEVYHADVSQVGKAIRCWQCGSILTIGAPVSAATHAASPIPEAPHGMDRSTRSERRYTPAAPAKKRFSYPMAATIVMGLVLVFAIWAASDAGPERDSPSVTQTEAWGRLASDWVPATGRDLWPPEWRGLGVLRVENGTEFDAVIRLVNQQSIRTERVVFIRAGDTARVIGIGTGTYVLKYGLGWGLTEQGTFGRYEHYGQFESELVFSETRQQTTIYEVTLHKVAGGEARTRGISEDDFLESDPPRSPMQGAQRTRIDAHGPLAAIDA